MKEKQRLYCLQGNRGLIEIFNKQRLTYPTLPAPTTRRQQDG
jgi:hypothetical protein